MPGRGAIREGDGMLAQSWESLLEEGEGEAVWAPDRPFGVRRTCFAGRPWERAVSLQGQSDPR